MSAGLHGAVVPVARSGEAPPARLSRPDRRPGLVLNGTRRSFTPGSTVYAHSEPAEFIYQVVSGTVRTITLNREGRRIVHGFHLTGEIFGHEREKHHHSSAEALERTCLIQCPKSLANSNADAAEELWSSLLLSRDRTAERVMYIIYGSAFEKLAYFLVDLAWRKDSSGRIDLPMSRYDIGDYLGLSSETVSRTFTAFRTRGLISTNARQVRLLSDDIQRMGARLRADEDDAAVRPPTLT